MDNHTHFDSSELVRLKQQVAELEMRNEHLHSENKYFKQLYKRAPLGYQSLDQNGCFLEVNQTWLDTLGYTREEVLGRNFAEFLPLDGQDHFTENFPRFIASGEILGIEFEMIRKDGTPLLVSFDGRTGTDQEGRFQQTHCIFQDITGRKRTERALLESEEKYRLLSENATDVIWTLDLATEHFTYVSPSVQRIRGYTATEAMAIPLNKTLLPESYQRAKAQIRESLLWEVQYGTTQGRVRLMEFEEYCKDGTAIHTEAQVKFTRDKDGRATGVIGVSRDITGRKRIDAALRLRESSLSALIENQPGLLWLKDKDGRFLSVNRAFAKSCGFNDPELLTGKTDLDIWPRDLAGKYIADDVRVMQSGQPYTVEETISDQGAIKWFETFKTPIIDGQGKVIGTTGYARDITERKRAEEALRESHEILSAILNAIPVRVFWKDTDLKYLGCNTGFARDAGFEKPEDIIGKDDSAMGWRDLAELYRTDDRAVIEKGEARLLIEEPQTTPSGEQIHLLTSKIPLRDAEGKIAGVLGTYFDITERRQTQKALQQSEERYRMLIDLASDGIILFSPAGIITEANQYLASMLGMAKEDFIGKHVSELPFTPESLRDKPLQFDLLQQGKIVINQRMLLRSDGKEIAVEMRSKMMPDGTCQSIGRDITECKRSEKLLKESEAKYCAAYTLMRLLCDNVPDMIWAKDLEKRYLFANKAVCRDLLIAADTEEPAGKTDMFFAGRERARHADNPQWHTFGEICGDTDALTMEAGIPQQFEEYGNVRGKFLFLDVHKAPFRDENGTMIGTVGSGRDVTLIKDMEQKLRESEQRLKLALLGADLATWDWHIPSGTVTSNERWAEMLGLAPGEVEPHLRTWQSLVHPEDLPRVTQTLNDHCEGKTESYESAHRLRHKSGEWVWVLDKGRVIERDPQGKPLRACGTHLDITEHKRTEEEKRNLRAQLIQAQKMEAIGTLAGGIAHDFNNILSAILGYAELALDGSSAGSLVTKDLEKVVEAGNRAATLVKQILAFSRQHDTERIPLKPCHIAKEAIKLLRPSLPSTIAIRQHIDAATPSILADPTQVHQILMNLCTNAFHAMEQTGGTLEITLTDRDLSPKDLQEHPEVSPGRFVVLSIGDTGMGIGPEIRDRIFDPYFTTKAVGKGTGMGLAIIHGIITSYGGFIICDSKPGEGTLFQVFFPALEREIVIDAKPVKAAPPGKERILLIDDEEILASLGKTMLERLGYEVTIRTSSLEALATFQNQPDRFDAVITDQTMPGMTGMDLARRMLQIRPNLPIILCTGYSTLVNEEQIHALGIKAFALKPLTKKEIAVLLRKVLDEGKHADLGA